MAVSLFSTVPVRLYALSVSLQASFTAGITGLGDIGALGQNLITKLTTPGGLIASGVDFIFGGPSFNPIMMLFCVILMAYAVIKVFFANLKRGGMLPGETQQTLSQLEQAVQTIRKGSEQDE